jgi:hypothetical protein
VNTRLDIVAAREGVCDGVQTARAEFHREVVSEELRHPLMLWHRRKSLIEQEFEGIVVCMHHKPPPPEVWPLVPDYLY